MRCAERAVVAFALALLTVSAPIRAGSLVAVRGQRYAMGTMFDIVVYHAAKHDAQRAIQKALDEIERLDRVMSHYDGRSELSRLHRDGRREPLTVDLALFDVIRESIDVSRRSGGTFDVTVAPLVAVWKHAEAEGRRPGPEELARARRCVGYETIELTAPDRIRLRSDCVAIDLGGIGKGYAVDRAMAILRASGIAHAVVNAGGSSIAAIGAPPGQDGWPVLVGEPDGHRRQLVLHATSMSTSQQDPAHRFGDIIDPRDGAPAASRTTAIVIAPTATLADALSTTLVVLSIDDGKRLLARFGSVSASWIAPDGAVQATFGRSQLAFAHVD